MKIASLLLCFILFYSCSESNYELPKPKNLVSRDTVISILEELSVVESYVQDNFVHVGIFQDLMKISGEAILEKFHVSPIRFEKTMDYYGTHQDQMIAIYQQVLDSLNKKASGLPQESIPEAGEPQNPVLKGFRKR